MLDSKELHFCLVLYFSKIKSPNKFEEFENLALKYASELSQLLTHFEPWPSNNRVLQRPYRYIKRNQDRLKKAITNEAAKGIDFYATGKDGDFIEAPLSFGFVNLKEEKGYGIVTMRCKVNILKKSHTGLHLSHQFIKDMNSLVDVKYGLVHMMQGRKYPGLYFLDSTSSIYLTIQEEKNVERWRKEGSRFESIVRGIYWGNIWSRSHWHNSKAKEKHLMKELEHECQGNVLWINKYTVFFCAPFDISDCKEYQSKLNEFRCRIHKICMNYDIEVLSNSVSSY
jgi:hypothetical protein